MSDPKRILIVEDEPNVRLVFRAALTSNAYQIAVAEDGETALRYLKQESADLVLLDLNMPVLGGMDVLRLLRESGSDLPVVIVSAYDAVPNVVQAMRLGAIDFIPKPTTPEALRKVVAEVLSRRVEPALPPGSSPAGASVPFESSDAMKRAKEALSRRAFREAEAALEQVIACDAHPAEGHYLVGILHEMRGEKDAAYHSYRAALKVDPVFEPARLHLLKYFNDRMM